MNVLIMGNSLRPNRSGAPVTGYNVATHDLIYGLLRHVQAETFCLVGHGDYQQETIETMISKIPKDRQQHIHVLSEYDVLFKGAENLCNPDILHSVKEDPIPLISARSHLGKNVPLTFLFHGLAEQHMLTDTFYPLLLLPFQQYDAILCSSSAVAMTIERMLDRLEEIGGRLFSHNTIRPPRIRLEKVPLGIDTDYYKPMPKSDARKVLGLPQDAIIILWFGRFSHIYKADLFPLLHVAQMLLQNTTSNIHLVLAGSEEKGSGEINTLRRLAEELGIQQHISIIENQNIPSRPLLYSAADIFTSPIDNLQETFGLTPVEAMSCGVPQVVSDWDGYRDTVENGVTGFRIPTIWTDCLNDVAKADYLPTNISHRRMLLRSLAVRSTVVDTSEYYKKMLALIENPDLRRRMSCASRQRAKEEYSLSRNAHYTESIWQELSEIAKRSNADPLGRQVPMIDYCNDFAAYPTEYLTRETEFRVTEFGLSCPVTLLRHDTLFSKYISEAQLPEMLLEYAKNNQSLNMLTAKYFFPRFSEDQILRSIMYLYKYDCLRPV